MLILKQNAANTVPTPPSGKGTIFLDDSDVLSVKTSDGNVETFPTVAASNAQVVYIDGTSLTGGSAFTYDFNNNILTVTGNIAAGNIKTDNLLYANGNPWDLEQPGGSNTQVQFNDDDSFGGSAAFTFNKSSNAVAMGGALTVTGNVTGGNLTTTGTASVGDINASGNAVIAGNLTVNGNLVYVNVESIAVEDPIIQLQSGPNGAAPSSNSGKDVGSALNYYNSQARIAFMGWDVSNAEFGLASEASIASEVVTFNTYGNLRAGVYFGNGSGLTSLTGANVTGTVANATHASTANTVVDAAQPNITSVGTLTSVTVTGTATAGNLSTGGTLNVTGNSNVVNLGASGVLLVTGNATAGNVYANSGTVGASLLTGTLTTAAQPNITSVGTLTSVTVSGNANVGNIGAAAGVFTGNISSLNANLGNLVTANVANLVDLNVSGNANIGGGSGGNISGANNITANTFTGTLTTAAQPNITSVGTLTSLDVTGNVLAGNVYSNSGTIGASLLTGTLTTAAQPNVTSVGTLTSLAVTGNATAGNVYSNSGTIGASLLTGTLTTAAQPNITSVGTLGSLSVTGNASAGNISTGGVLSVTGNANVGNLGTAGLITATGNVSGGNITTAGQLVSSVSTGTAPLVVSSTTKVANLNADLLDGYSTATAATANTVVIRDADGSFSANIITGTLSGAATTAGTVTTAAQPNITSVGTLTGLGVNGTVTAVAFTANTGVFTGNGSGLSAIAGANVTGEVAYAATANAVAGANVTGEVAYAATANAVAGANVSGQVGNALVAGTVYTAAQPNITSVGTLSGLTVDGSNITLANGVYVGNGSGLSAIAGANVTGTVSSATTAGTVTTAAQPNITSVGTLSSLAVTGNISAGNVSATTFTGALSGAATTAGTVTTAAQPNITSVGTLSSLTVTGKVTAGQLQGDGGNISNIQAANVSGTVATATTAGTVTTAAQPNITSVGTLSSLTVTGKVTAGQLQGDGGNISNVQGANVSGTVATATTAGTVTTAAQPNVTSVGTLTGLTMGGNVAMGNYWVTGLNTPTNSTDAATKQYVDDVAQGLHTHDSCNAATDGTLATISGGTVTYNNGSSGVGATLTTTGSYTTIDGVTLQNGMRILVKNEANAAHNGIYDRTSSTVLTRSSDFDTPAEMAGGDFTFVNGGTLYDNTGWVMTDPVTTVGTTDVNWVQFSGAGTYTAGTGLTLTGTVFSVNASQTQITSVGTLGSLSVTGNASAGNLSTGGTLSVTGNANVGNIGAAAGVFTSVSGNGAALTALNASNISTGTLAQARLANSTLTLGNTTLTLGATTTTVAGLSSVTSTTFVGALTGAATTAGTVTTAAQPNITSVGTLSSLSVTGNISAGNVSATTFTGALSGAATTAGTVTTAAQPNITSVGTLTGLGVNGTITGVNITANTGVFTGSGSGLSALNGSNISTGTIAAARVATLNQNTTGYAATVSSAAQPNITSVGTLTSLSSSGNITAPNLIANTGMFISSVNAAVSAAGTVQGNATALTTQINVVGTVSSGQGVRLPTAVAGMRVTIMNTSANALAVYPASGGKVNSAATNASFSQAAGARLDFVAVSTTQWYTLNATYA